MDNNASAVSVNGTYYHAQKDKSIDYLAIQIPMLSGEGKGNY